MGQKYDPMRHGPPGDDRFPDDQSGRLWQRPAGTDNEGRGAHGQFEVAASRGPVPDAQMGRSFGGVGGIRDARGSYAYRGGDDYLRGGHGAPRWQDSRTAARGPRIRRDDRRIEEDINEWLTADPRIDATDVEVRCRDGAVTLSGAVEHRWQRYYIEDAVEQRMGIAQIDNRLRVSGRQS
jgi:hypothetical protein